MSASHGGIAIVCWRWGTRYDADYVNRLSRMLARNLHLPYRLFCITDDPTGLHPSVIPIPLPPVSNLGRCRRLRVFDPSYNSIFACDRLVQIDIDCVITGEITHLLDRDDPLVLWRSLPEKRYSRKHGLVDNTSLIGPYNTSLILMDRAIFPTLWSDYLQCPEKLEGAARASGFSTLLATAVKRDGQVLAKTTSALAPGDDDQAIVSLYAHPLNPPVWTESDGIYKLGRRGFSNRAGDLPPGARMVFFNGSIPSNTPDPRWDWIKEHWR